ncbi:MAG TPA: AsmA family protein [Bryobacteraceae bacterium]|nr:AsmA family protein [Bryobacteraceae bacterium]
MKRILRLLAIAVALLLLIVVALPFVINPNQFRPTLEAELTKALAREVKVGDLKLAILSGGVTADDLSVADDPAYSGSPFLHTRSLTLGVDLWPLIFSKRLHVTRIVIDQPEIDLIQSAAGDWNFSSLGGKSNKPAAPPPPATAGAGAGMNLSVNLVKITKGRLTFAQRASNAKARVLEDVSMELRDFSASAAFPFMLAAKLAGGGDIQLNGTAGPVDATDAAATPVKVSVKLNGFDLGAAGLEGSAGLAGLISINGMAASNGKTVWLTGHLKAEHLKLARNGTPAKEPVEFDITLDHDLRKRAGVLRRGDIHIGTAPASLTGTYAAQGDSATIDMTLSGPQMPVPQLAAMLPAFGVVLPAGSSFEGGTASAKLTFTGPAEALATSGTLALNNTRLTGFDLGSKMSTVEKLAGIKTGPNTDIQTFSATVHMAPLGSTIQDIKLVAPALGEVEGAGTISPSQALDFKMRATLHTGNAAMALIGAKSDTGVPFLVEGTASNPVFRPDIKGLATQRVQAIEKQTVGKAAGSLLNGVLGKKKK